MTISYLPIAHRRRLALLSSAAVALAAPFALAAPAFAADAAVAAAGDASGDASDFGSDIVVTARHREEKAQNVPVAISVLGAQTLEQTGDYSLGQIQHEVPTLQVVNYNPRNSVITIRGLGANSSLAVDGLEYGIGFYLDGVYYGRPGQTQFDLLDLQQIEVLRGPQGTLFGKNTTAGAINVTSKEPSFSPEATVEATYGNYNTEQLRASVSAPLIADKLAFRVTASDTHHDGYLTNTYDNSKAENYNDVSVRGQLLYTPSERLKIRLIGDYSQERQHYILSLLDGNTTQYSNGATIPWNFAQRVAYGASHPGYYSVPYTAPTYGAFARLGDSNSPYQANMESFGGSGEVDYDLGGAKLTSITAYRKWNWWPHNDADSTPLSVNTVAQQQNFQRQFSQEFRVASSGRHFIDYVVGAYYFWQTVPGYGITTYGSDFAAWSLNPATNSPAKISLVNTGITNAEADSYSVANTSSYALYGQTDTHFTDALTLTTGLRFTHEDKDGEYVRWQNANSVAQLATLSTALGAAGPPTLTAFQLTPLSFGATTHNNAVSGLATLSYKVARDVLVYGTYSHGSKSGGLNITAGGIAQPVVNPEKVDNFEAGLKSQFLNHTLTANVDAFLTNVTDYQANVSITSNNVTVQYISNIPKVRSKGVEADLAYAPSKWFGVSASGAYTDAKYVSYANAPAPSEAASTAPQNLSGVLLPGVSKFAFTLSGDVAQPIARDYEIYAHADYLHRSSFNTTATNSIYGLVPAYGVVNGRIGVRSANRRYDLSVWAKNLTNANYYTSRSESTYGLITATVGDPRTFGATLRVKL